MGACRDALAKHAPVLHDIESSELAVFYRERTCCNAPDIITLEDMQQRFQLLDVMDIIYERVIEGSECVDGGIRDRCNYVSPDATIVGDSE